MLIDSALSESLVVTFFCCLFHSISERALFEVRSLTFLILLSARAVKLEIPGFHTIQTQPCPYSIWNRWFAFTLAQISLSDGFNPKIMSNKSSTMSSTWITFTNRDRKQRNDWRLTWLRLKTLVAFCARRNS